MSNRLDQEREKELQPKRMAFAINVINYLKLEIVFKDETRLEFMFNGNKITLYPYSGWHSGKGIVAGRGIEKLLKQLKPTTHETNS